MPIFPQPLVSSLPHLTIVSVLDILLIAFLIYHLLMAVRGRRAANILFGALILAGVYLLVSALGLELVRSTLASLAPYAPFALIVLFQSEIRRLLARMGGRQLLSFGGRLQKREFAEELVLTARQLQQHNVGALIVIERDIGLRSFVESGVLMEAYVSLDLLATIFHPGSPLHDGAVIIQGTKIAAAACVLPLTVKPSLARRFGTRHRAGIGITEETDCFSIIVSEETGRISVAAFGEIEMNVNAARLQERVHEHVIDRRSVPTRRVEQDEREQAHFEREAARDATAD